MIPGKVPVSEQCEAEVMVDPSLAMLVCYLREGHDGPHWDSDDEVTWWVARHHGLPRADNSYSVKLTDGSDNAPGA